MGYCADNDRGLIFKSRTCSLYQTQDSRQPCATCKSLACQTTSVYTVAIRCRPLVSGVVRDSGVQSNVGAEPVDSAFAVGSAARGAAGLAQLLPVTSQELSKSWIAAGSKVTSRLDKWWISPSTFQTLSSPLEGRACRTLVAGYYVQASRGLPGGKCHLVARLSRSVWQLPLRALRYMCT